MRERVCVNRERIPVRLGKDRSDGNPLVVIAREKPCDGRDCGERPILFSAKVDYAYVLFCHSPATLARADDFARSAVEAFRPRAIGYKERFMYSLFRIMLEERANDERDRETRGESRDGLKWVASAFFDTIRANEPNNIEKNRAINVRDKRYYFAAVS